MTKAKIDDTKFTAQNWTDEDGNHQGGQSFAPGVCIAWQRGPIEGALSENQNGAPTLTVLRIIEHQINYYQLSKFSCKENEEALKHVRAAIAILEDRKNRRKASGTLGTHLPDN